jgi:hypothetical protein
MRTLALLTLTCGVVLGQGASTAGVDRAGPEDGPRLRVCPDNPGGVCAGQAGPAAANEPSMMRVRSNGDPAVTRLLHDAIERSPTFRRLVETINGTDGLIYIEPGTCGPGFHACLLMSVTVAGPNRVLRIRVDTRRDPPAVMASIGHELQHAVEALSEAGVRTNALIYAFFERLSGSPGARGQLEFETEAAVKAGDAVRNDIQASLRGKQ